MQMQTIDPGDGDRLEEDGKQDGIPRGKTIHKVNNVDTALGATGQAHDKVKAEQDGHKHFAVSLNDRILIADRRDDRLASSEL